MLETKCRMPSGVLDLKWVHAAYVRITLAFMQWPCVIVCDRPFMYLNLLYSFITFAVILLLLLFICRELRIDVYTCHYNSTHGAHYVKYVTTNVVNQSKFLMSVYFLFLHWKIAEGNSSRIHCLLKFTVQGFFLSFQKYLFSKHLN